MSAGRLRFASGALDRLADHLGGLEAHLLEVGRPGEAAAVRTARGYAAHAWLDVLLAWDAADQAAARRSLRRLRRLS